MLSAKEQVFCFLNSHDASVKQLTEGGGGRATLLAQQQETAKSQQ
jgi:hypothetical protein